MNVYQRRSFETQVSGAVTTSAPSVMTFGPGFITGDIGVQELTIAISHSLTIGSGTTPRTDGETAMIESIYLETDKHNSIVENVDGLGLHRVISFIYGTRPFTTAIAATTGVYQTGMTIPLCIPGGYRQFDTILDLAKARIQARVQYSDLSKAFGTVGTASDLITTQWSGFYRVGLATADLPFFQPSYRLKRVTISASGSIQIPLDYGGLIYLGIGIAQRDATTYVERTNIVSQATNVRLEVNGFDHVGNTNWRELQVENKQTCQLEVWPLAWAYLDFWKDQGRIADAINTLNKQGNMNLYLDQLTSDATSQLWIYTFAIKPIPPLAARIPAQLTLPTF